MHDSQTVSFYPVITCSKPGGCPDIVRLLVTRRPTLVAHDVDLCSSLLSDVAKVAATVGTGSVHLQVLDYIARLGCYDTFRGDERFDLRG